MISTCSSLSRSVCLFALIDELGRFDLARGRREGARFDFSIFLEEMRRIHPNCIGFRHQPQPNRQPTRRKRRARMDCSFELLSMFLLVEWIL